MEPLHLGSPGSPDTNLYLPSFLMDELQTPTTPRNNPLSRNKAVGRNLSFGFTNSTGGVASATQNYSSTRPALGQKTLFGGHRQTPTWGQNASKYIGTPAQNLNTSTSSGPPVQGLFDSLRNETNQVQTPLRTQRSNTPPFDRTYVGQGNIKSALNQGMQQEQVVNLTGPMHDSLLSNNPSQALQCEAQMPYKGFWVTVYGFPSTAISTILQHFSQCGTIMDKVMPSHNGNWIHLKYSSRLECDKALNYNGKILANNIMIAVTQCKDNDLLDKENFSDNAMDSAKARPLSQLSYNDTRRYTSGPNYICGIQRNAGLLNKFLDLFFAQAKLCFDGESELFSLGHQEYLITLQIKWYGIATLVDGIFSSISKDCLSKESNFGMKGMKGMKGIYYQVSLANMSIAICVPSGISTPLLRRKSPDARRNTIGTGAKRRIASLITISVYCIRSNCSIVTSSSIN
uniref:Nucleoporin NUP35 n=1 Tax=Glossina austeni TaxID=7395 RepID=A0A1A9VSL4_GLOAU